MKNVLFFAFEFAPNNTTGAHRYIKFVKNLKAFGINPIVVTAVAEDSFRSFGGPIDNQLMDGLHDIEIVRFPITPRSSRLHKLKIFNFFKLFFRIDEGLSARWPVDLRKLLEVYNPEAVVVTLPPFSMWRLVKKIKSCCSLPVITDMRDAWALWAPAGYFSRLHYYVTLRTERRLFQISDKVLGVTPQLVDLFRRSHPMIPANRFAVVYNFFDSLSFKIPESQNISFQSGQRIRIGYVGTFYYTPRTKKKLTDIFRHYPIKDDWLYRSPYFFLKTLSELYERFPDFKKHVFFEFAGKIPPWLMDMISSFKLERNVVLHGFLNAKQVKDFQRDCDFFLATSEKIEGGEHYCLPSKLFEYIKTGKPILGFVTEGVQREFLQNCGVGITFEPDDIENNAKRLAELFSNSKFAPVNVREEYVMTFSDRSQTRIFADLIHSSANRTDK